MAARVHMAWMLLGSLAAGDHNNSNKFLVSVTAGGYTAVNVSIAGLQIKLDTTSRMAMRAPPPLEKLLVRLDLSNLYTI